MKPRDLFSLALKIIGFIILLQGVRNCVEGLLILKGYATVRLSTPQYWSAMAIIKIGAGVYLMIGGRLLVNVAFRRSPPDRTGEVATPAGTTSAERAPASLLSAKIIFDLGVKIIGLILVLYGLEYFFDALLYAMKTPEASEVQGHNWVVRSIAEILLGLAMLRGILPLADFAFPASTAATQPNDEKTSSQEQK